MTLQEFTNKFGQLLDLINELQDAPVEGNNLSVWQLQMNLEEIHIDMSSFDALQKLTKCDIH